MTTKYRLYCQPEGSIASYCGEFETRALAASAADRSPRGLSEDQWETARRAGHCGGLCAPDAAGQEDDEPLMWVGEYYAVRVRYNEQESA